LIRGLSKQRTTKRRSLAAKRLPSNRARRAREGSDQGPILVVAMYRADQTLHILLSAVKNRIACRDFVQGLRHGVGVHGAVLAKMTEVDVQFPRCVSMFVHHPIQKGRVFLAVDERQQRPCGLADLPPDPEVDGAMK
jgi:hypothetical protein